MEPLTRRVGAALAAALLSGGCGSSACSDTILSGGLAPGGAHSVAMFSRDCGATTDFSTQISVLSPDQAPVDAGNVFIADGGGTPTAWRGPWAEVAWLGRDRLLIRYDSRARLIKRAARLGGVSITYQPVAM